MTGLVSKLHEQPFILEQVDDGMIIAEALRFISLGSIAATHRHWLTRLSENQDGSPPPALQRQRG